MVISPKSVCITSITSDTTNTNHIIRDYLCEGMKECLADSRVVAFPYESWDFAISSNQPELTIAVGSLAHDMIEIAKIRHLCNQAGSKLAFWLHDDPYEFDYSYKVEDVADLIFTTDLWSSMHYRHDKCFHVPLAASKSVHYRPVIGFNEKPIDLFFCGAAYPNRVEFVTRSYSNLRHLNWLIRGSDWPDTLPPHCNTRLTVAEFCNHAQRARATLYLSRSHNIANRRYDLIASTPGPRVFEVAAAGSLQFYHIESLEICKYFEESSEILFVDDPIEVSERIEWCVRNPDMADEIASRAQQRVLGCHTYRHRAAEMLRYFSES